MGNDLVLPDPDPDEVVEVGTALTVYCAWLAKVGAPPPRIQKAAETQRRFIKENAEALREAYLAIPPEDLTIDPRTHDEFLAELELIVVNGELRDGRKTIIYEEEEDDGSD